MLLIFAEKLQCVHQLLYSLEKHLGQLKIEFVVSVILSLRVSLFTV
jgi:hypothetical protein